MAIKKYFDKFLTMRFLLHLKTKYAIIILKLKPGLKVHNLSQYWGEAAGSKFKIFEVFEFAFF